MTTFFWKSLTLIFAILLVISIGLLLWRWSLPSKEIVNTSTSTSNTNQSQQPTTNTENDNANENTNAEAPSATIINNNTKAVEENTGGVNYVNAKVTKAPDSTPLNPWVTITLELSKVGRTSCVWWGLTDSSYIGSTDATGADDPPMTHQFKFPCPTDTESDKAERGKRNIDPVLLNYELQGDCRDIEGNRYIVNKMIFTINDKRCL